MAFSINEFRNTFADYEPASPAYYEVHIVRQPEAFLQNEDTYSEDSLRYRCISCSLPGKAINTTERLTYGPTRKIALSSVYQDITFSFIVSDDKAELKYFNSWHNFIINNTLNTNVQTHDVGYYEKYVGNLTIQHFDKTDETDYRIQLLEAYPINVEEIPLSWDNTNEFIRVNVTMAYRTWQRIQPEK